jgi:hypothetical protein
MEVLVGAAVALGSLELLARRRVLADDGVWRWRTLAPELGPLRAVLAYRPFVAVLAVRLVLALALVAGARGAVAPALWVATLVVNLRFRGTFNGGSDLMTMVALTGLAVAHLGHRSPVVVAAALVYVAAQATLSYLVAGVVKVANPQWRRGEALAAFVARPDVAVVRRAVGGPRRARAASWAVMGFECAFPLAFVSVAAAWVFVALALVFHLATVAAFGLNRFLFAWASTWPAVVWVARLV